MVILIQWKHLRRNGMDEFAQYFGSVLFKCNEVTYHEKSGRIATMIFEALQE